MVARLLFLLFGVLFSLSSSANDFEEIICKLQSELIKSLPDTLDNFVGIQMNLFDIDGSYHGIDYSNKDIVLWKPAEHYNILRLMAGAYVNPESDYYKNNLLYSLIEKGLDFWYKNDPESDNWWWEQIDEQQKVGEILILMRAGDEKIPKALEDSLIVRMATNGGSPNAWVGANRVDIALHWFYRGLLTDDFELLKTSIEFVYEPIDYNDGGEGFQVDGGFFQHGQQLYLGGYAELFLKSVLKVAICTKGSEFEISQEKLEILRNFIKSTFANVIRGQYINYNCIGRNLSRKDELSRTDVWKPLFKQMKVLDNSDSCYDDIIYRLESNGEAQKGIKPYHHHFFKGDYTLHVRPQYSFSVRLNSPRTIQNETLSSENLLGYFLSYGGTTIERRGEEYYNIMPLWDWNSVPGVTSPKMESIPLVNYFYQEGIADYCGGVSDSIYGVSAIKYYDTYKDVNTGASKAWFFFDDEVVCLGSGINSNYQTTTTLNQCHKNDQMIIGYRDGQIERFDSGVLSSDRISWVSHDSIGYFFPLGGSVEVEADHRENCWTVVNRDFSDVVERGDVFRLSLNHNIPVDEKYQYIVIPGIGDNAMIEYVGNCPIKVYENSSDAQIVYHSNLNLLGAVFYKPYTYKNEIIEIHVSDPCILLLNLTHKDSMIIHAQDLSYQMKIVEVNVNNLQEGGTFSARFDFSQMSGSYAGISKRIVLPMPTLSRLNEIKMEMPTKFNAGEPFVLSSPKDGMIRLYSLKGICLFQEKIKAGTSTFMIPNPGVYTMVVNFGLESECFKLIVD